MSDISDHAAMVISHNRLTGGKHGSPCGRRYVLQTLSNRHEVLRGTKQVEMTIVDAGYSIRNARLVGNSSGAPNG
jgi:hypothetical protein